MEHSNTGWDCWWDCYIDLIMGQASAPLQLLLVKLIKPCLSQVASCSQGAELIAQVEPHGPSSQTSEHTSCLTPAYRFSGWAPPTAEEQQHATPPAHPSRGTQSNALAVQPMQH